jgi:hypothetical protein
MPVLLLPVLLLPVLLLPVLLVLLRRDPLPRVLVLAWVLLEL